MAGFVRHRRSKHIIATLSGFEADLLRSLAAQLVELLRNEAAVPSETADPLEALFTGGEFSGPTTAPEDPVLARLFPSAYRDDGQAAAEFRRFTEGSLRDGKAQAAATIIDTLEEAGLPAEPGSEELTIDVELDLATAEIWMRALTDLRLALGTRLEVEEGDEDYWYSLPDDDPRGQAHHIYEWLGYLQETLIHAVGGSAQRAGLTASTGHGASRITRCATLPSSSLPTGVRCRTPTTITSAEQSSAADSTASATSGTTSWRISTSSPSAASRSRRAAISSSWA